jgi:predicted RNase H-like nuclease (RuvC/YqgF family)
MANDNSTPSEMDTMKAKVESLEKQLLAYHDRAKQLEERVDSNLALGAYLQRNDDTIMARDEELKAENERLKYKDEELKAKDGEIRELQEQVEEMEKSLRGKDELIKAAKAYSDKLEEGLLRQLDLSSLLLRH